MTLLDVVVVALIQGLAQVLPLSASGHLALVPRLIAAPESRAVLAAAEAGVAAALALYFWRDLVAMAVGAARLTKGRVDAGGRLLLQVAAGSLPALALGWAFLELGGGGTGGRTGAAVALLLFGLFLLAADRLGVTVRRIDHLGWGGAVAVGLLQAAALIPGVSRTGITITAARLMGFERQEAARFSLLLGLPLIAGHAAYGLWQVSRQMPLVVTLDLAVAAGLALLAGLIAVTAMMAWLDRHGLAPFALWRIALGGVMLALALLS